MKGKPAKIYKKRSRGLTMEAKYNSSGWLIGYRITVDGYPPSSWHRVTRYTRKLESMGYINHEKDLPKGWR